MLEPLAFKKISINVQCWCCVLTGNTFRTTFRPNLLEFHRFGNFQLRWPSPHKPRKPVSETRTCWDVLAQLKHVAFRYLANSRSRNRLLPLLKYFDRVHEKHFLIFREDCSSATRIVTTAPRDSGVHSCSRNIESLARLRHRQLLVFHKVQCVS